MGLMTGLRHALRIDNWSMFNYKPLFADPTTGMPQRRAFPEAAAMWVPAEDERRLASYKLLAAYDQNQAGELAEIRDGAEARERREYGDPAMFVDTLVSHVLGREQSITVPGAEHADDDQPDPQAVQAERVQELLREWADEELLPMRLLQAERKAVGLGDGVLHLWWDADKQRPRITTYDPGFYFPVIDEDSDGTDYPTRIHFAWELPEDKKRRLPARLRRITYELDWIRPATASGVDRQGRPVRAPVLTEATDDEPAIPVLGRGDRVDHLGAISRMYPWSEQPSYKTCYLTDGIWLLEDLTGDIDVDSLPMEKAHFNSNSQGEVLDRLDIYQDFISVIHLPNTVPAAGEHWGQSSLAKALQVFDELAASDTDSARASGTTGLPMIAISGVHDSNQRFNVGPGALFTLGENGKMTAVDTSAALRELREHGHDLHDRAANVVRLPAVALGTMDPSKVPSGYALELSLGPLDSNIAGMRLARDHADRLIPKFVQRLFHAGQHPDWAGLPVLPAKLTRGPYTPTDKAAVLDQVTTAYLAKVISLETAIRMLQDAGWPISDAQAEVKQIESRSFEAARQLADATGDTKLVADYLGVDINPDPTPPPAPQLPGLPSDNTPTNQPDAQPGGSGGNTS
ncbi:hypothetical protein D0Z67_29115 (plasmid) [Streptomyces seoulensis]|uniref:Phage portal protein n=1 Tax=Streptomyces seoulensis TaxID=73044 RepID=A0A4P6U4T6_STRSO|nr:hypothetical protein [Streptomyces seoulensis]QBJ94433.1 hypothetical protein D0Z67_29115 [Streptomyces seoulensis]